MGAVAAVLGDDEDVLARLTSRALIVSIAATAGTGILGVVLGLASGSSLIILDAAYAFVGIGLSWLLLRASALSAQGPSRRYPFGREAATPLAIGVQGVALLATLGYALVDAVRTIVEGGSDVAPGVAFLYAVISATVSIATWGWLRRFAHLSEVLGAEVLAWRIAVFRGLAIVLAFSLMWVLDGSSWSHVVPYLDPGMVIVTCLLFAGAPFRMVHSTIVELMEGAPPERIQQPALAAIEEVRTATGLPAPTVRMTKVGPKLYVEIDVLVDPSVTVGEEDRVRRAMRARLDELPFEVWMNVELSADPTWGVDAK